MAKRKPGTRCNSTAWDGSWDTVDQYIADLEALLNEAEKCIHSVYKPGYAVCPGSEAMDLIEDWLDRKRKLIP